MPKPYCSLAFLKDYFGWAMPAAKFPVDWHGVSSSSTLPTDRVRMDPWEGTTYGGGSSNGLVIIVIRGHTGRKFLGFTGYNLFWTKSTQSTSREVRGSPATIEYYGRRLLLRGRCSTWRTSVFILRGKCSTWRTSVSFCVAGAALGAPQSHFAWQVQHSEHLSLISRGRCST